MTTRRSEIDALASAGPTRPGQAPAGQDVEALRQLALQYRSIFEHAIHGIYQSLPEGRFLNVNPALARMLGYDSPADMIATCIDIACHYYADPKERAQLLALLAKQEGRLQGYEVQVRRKDGTTIWTRENVYEVRDEKGRLLYYEGSVENITAQKQAEADLRDSEERYRNLFEYANDIIYTNDLEGNYTSVNRVGEQTTGYSREELCQMNFTQFVAPEYLDLAREMMARKLAGEEATTFYEIEIINKAGARVRLEVSTQLIYDHGRPVGVQGIARNITERRQAEEALRRSEEQFRAQYRGIPVPTYTWRRDGDDFRLIDYNDKAAEYTQGKIADLLGTKCSDMYSDRPDIVDAFQRCFQECDAIIVEGPYRFRTTGQERYLRASFAFVPPDLVMVHTEDITLRKQAEAALRASEERYRELFENANDIVYTHDLKGNFTSLNNTGECITGYTRAEVSQMNIAQVVAPEHLSLAREMLGRMRSDGEPTVYELEIIAKDGRRVPLEISTRLVYRDGAEVGVQGIARDITERRQAEERLRQHALSDSLTGLPNRLLFTDHLRLAVEQARRHSEQRFAVLFLDLDRFKMINDSLGHTLGDQLLVAIARQLDACLRGGDTVARLGGDEFAILLNNIVHFDDSIRVAERVLHDMQLPFNLDGHEVFTTASIGIALSDNRYETAEAVLRDADIAMYRAKAEGKARYQVFDLIMHDRVVALLQLENDLRRAIEREEFRLHYQPIVALADGRVIGFEALVRWQHPERGLISPLDFIPVAEETGLIVPLGHWVLRAACTQMKRWQQLSPRYECLKLSVNLSGKQFVQTDLYEQIEQALAKMDFDPHCLQLEITESVLMENAATIVPMLSRLRDLGVELAIDDFGTGYSSLSYLRRFPIHTLKIDRSFMRVDDVENAEIVRTIVLLARNMRKEVVAEGVETVAELATLRALDCAYGQGYLFSPPQDADSTERLLTHKLDRDLCLQPTTSQHVA